MLPELLKMYSINCFGKFFAKNPLQPYVSGGLWRKQKYANGFVQIIFELQARTYKGNVLGTSKMLIS